MRRLLVVMMLSFAAVVGIAATTAPVMTAQDCVMWARSTPTGGEELACWSGPCDLADSVCQMTYGMVNGLEFEWCVCSKGENVGECGGHGIKQWGSWLVYCGQQPCLNILGFCHPNKLEADVWKRACSCGYLPPPWV
ncbi:MAG: hypothetical protein R3F56_17790 [Planctomycetota bacterium]